jgi:hypothetical protein
MRHCHVDIRRENREQQRDQSPSGQPPERRDQQSKPAGDFTNTTDNHKHRWRWKAGRNDALVKERIPKMIQSRENKSN